MRPIVIATFLLLLANVHAQATRDALYQALVTVHDRSPAQRDAALQSALEQVLVKLTGITNDASQVTLKLPASAAQLVQEYRYRDTFSSPGSELWVKFDRLALDAAMQTAGVEPWRGHRPQPLLWFVVRSGEGDLSLGDSGAISGLEKAIVRGAWERGITVRKPLLDLEDRVQLKAQQLFALDSDAIRHASRRYGYGPVAVVRIAAETQARWQVHVVLIERGDPWSWRDVGDSPTVLVQRATQRLVDELLRRYGMAHAPEESVAITVTGVSSASDYGRLMNYFRSLQAVSAVSVTQTVGSELQLRLTIRGGLVALIRIVSMHEQLAPSSQASVFQWSGSPP